MVIIEGNRIGPGERAFLVAEAGVNHDGRVDRALEMVRVAAWAGADAIKFQTFRSDALASREAHKAAYQVRNSGSDGLQLEMLRRLELDQGAFARIRRACQECGIIFLSTPFDEASASMLVNLGVGAFKIGSGDLTNLPFLARLAEGGHPLLLSTGMATLDEVSEAVSTIQQHGAPPLVVLHCVSSYPAPCEEYNLRAMATMREAFGVPVGLSDHTLGWEVALGAISLGACVIEKHFTLDRSLAGPDHAASLEPSELKLLVDQVRRLESALGDGAKRPMPSEASTREVARKSVVVVRDLAAGTVLKSSDLAIKRPGTGIPPKAIASVPGRVLRKEITADSVLQEAHLLP